MKANRSGVLRLILQVLQGVMIGVGAVLPGISGGVLCVVFGIYKPVMELLSNPFRRFRTHVPKLPPHDLLSTPPAEVGQSLVFHGAQTILRWSVHRRGESCP